MSRSPILDLPLNTVMRSEIALPLQHLLRIYTVGNLLDAWRSPKARQGVEQIFDSPQQARHAVAVCAGWLGVRSLALAKPVAAWWAGDERPVMNA